MKAFFYYLTLPYLLKGITTTVEITIGAMLTSAVVGSLLANLNMSNSKVLSSIARTYTVIARGTPLILQLVFIYDALPHLGLKFGAMTSAIIAIGFNGASFFAEIVRGSVSAVDKGQVLAAEALGMRPGVLMRRIVSPQALRVAIPLLGNELVTTMKNSSLASVISAQELTLRSEQLVSQDFAFFSIFTASGFMYLFLAAFISGIQLVVERALDLNKTELTLKTMFSRIVSLQSGRRALGEMVDSTSGQSPFAITSEVAPEPEVDLQQNLLSNNGQELQRPEFDLQRHKRISGGKDGEMGRPMIEGTALWKSYGNVEVLRNMNFQVEKGEVVVLLGSSGSGKSTLLRLINHLEDLDNGELLVQGSRIGYDFEGKALSRRQVADARANARIGMVFQQFNLFSHLTALENVAGPLRWVRKVDQATAQQKALITLGKVGLGDKANVLPRFLSGGQQQRVAIARALALDPEILLLDEPTSALDPELVGEVLQVIRDLTRTGMTMLIVTHELRFARQVADRILFFEKGEIVEDGIPSEVFSNPTSDGMKRYLKMFELSDSSL